MLSRLTSSNTSLFICDVQDRFRSLIYKSESLINKCTLLNKACIKLGLPCIVTEQYSKALGKTVPELLTDIDKQVANGSYHVLEKKKFSMMTDATWNAFNATGSKHVILCGIEAHVCVLQTVLDLTEAGIKVHLVTDAISSQNSNDRETTLIQLRKNDLVTMTTTETVLFEMMRSAEHPNFKEVSALIKEYSEKQKEIAGGAL